MLAEHMRDCIVNFELKKSSQMKKAFTFSIGVMLVLAVAGLSEAEAAKAKKFKPHKRADYTEEQRAKFMEQARKICKKKYGAPSRVAEIDYYHWKVWCTSPGY
jgi:hypothetical protein